MDSGTARAVEIMREYVRLTGLSPPDPDPKRYLWTDAFAVCNYLELFRRAGHEPYRALALALVDQVHRVLGRHRGDDSRTGWISGLSDEEGALRPTAGGLRIGKRLNERGPGEPPDERLEWDQDGQYYHYLTKWMHALERTGRATGDPTYLKWAIELAKTAHARFTYAPRPGGPKRMYWKMSIDLSRPLVTSMGQHDPLDGFVTYNELQAAAAAFPESTMPGLSAEIAEMAGICRGIRLATDDPLGIGGLLFDATRIAQLTAGNGHHYPALLLTVLDAALLGTRYFAVGTILQMPAEYRLAFRELGLSIGFAGLGMIEETVARHPDCFGDTGPLVQRIEALREFAPLSEEIETFWMDSASQEACTWTEHREINMVMLATSLAPGEFLHV